MLAQQFVLLQVKPLGSLIQFTVVVEGSASLQICQDCSSGGVLTSGLECVGPEGWLLSELTVKLTNTSCSCYLYGSY